MQTGKRIIYFLNGYMIATHNDGVLYSAKIVTWWSILFKLLKFVILFYGQIVPYFAGSSEEIIGLAF